MNNKSLVVYGTQSIVPTVLSGQILYAQGIRQYVPDGMDDDERRTVLRDASLVYEALLRVGVRHDFYGALLDGAPALIARYGKVIGEFERDERLQYAMKCCIAAGGSLLGKLCREMERVPSIISRRQMIRQLRLNPDVMETVSMNNWRWAGFSECEKTGICFHDGSEHPPFMKCCPLDKTRLRHPEEWRGDDGCYAPVNG
ncbi:MAG: hypothetical protein WCJ25_02535 [Candidatus Moraniibacteriota bacterium]